MHNAPYQQILPLRLMVSQCNLFVGNQAGLGLGEGLDGNTQGPRPSTYQSDPRYTLRSPTNIFVARPSLCGLKSCG